MSKFSIDPSFTDSIIDFWFENSLDSIIKSLVAYLSEILYGKVFLSNDELLKSNDWSILELSVM